MWPFKPANSRVNEFWKLLNFSNEISKIETAANQLNSGLVSDEELSSIYEFSLLDRWFMCDFWAETATMTVHEFNGNLPQSQGHRNARVASDGFANYMTALLNEEKSLSGVSMRFRREKGEGMVESVLLRIATLFVAKFEMSKLDYRKFIGFEYGCWLLKNQVFQRMCMFRLKTEPELAWTASEVMELSDLTEKKLFPQIYHLKQTKGWDEISIEIKI